MTSTRPTAALILLSLVSIGAGAGAVAGQAATPATSASDAGPKTTVTPELAPAASDPAEPSPVPSAAFEGHTWTLAAFRSGKGLVEPKQGQRPALFELELGRLAGSPGCNRIMGSYRVDGDRIRVDPQMAATMMACPEPLMAQDKAVADALALAARVRLDGDLLELLDSSDQPVLRFLRRTPEPLVGPVWDLQSLNNGKQGIVSVLAGTQLSLELREDGTLGGFDGCNRFMSGYTLEQGKLAIGPLASTRMACQGPQGSQEQAALFARALGSVVGYRVEGDVLTLLDEQGQTAAIFMTPKGQLPAPAGPR